MENSERDEHWMALAIEIAAQGQGLVEPNPMVGCVLVRNDQEIGRGFHRQFGGKHAEVNAIEACQESPAGCTAYVSLEPCSHFGKTPPCADRLIEAQVGRVVVAQTDPFPAVAGQGIEKLKQAGISVTEGVLRESAESLNAPYRKLIQFQRPWVVAKWAMTLDGKIATASGSSQWITNEASRAVVHQLRGRMDAVVVGSNTAINDDPLLTARPPGKRTAYRVVFDSQLKIDLDSQLAKTARQVPTLIFSSNAADPKKRNHLESAGCEVIVNKAADRSDRLQAALTELGQRKMTNILVEGGSGLMGALFDIGQIDECHIFIGNRMIGGQQSIAPIAGRGVSQIGDGWRLKEMRTETIEDDVYISGRIDRTDA